MYRTYFSYYDAQLTITSLYGRLCLSSAQHHILDHIYSYQQPWALAANVDNINVNINYNNHEFEPPLVLVGLGSLEGEQSYFTELLVSSNDYGIFTPDLFNFDRFIWANNISSSNTFWWSFDNINKFNKHTTNTNNRNKDTNFDALYLQVSSYINDKKLKILGPKGGNQLNYWNWCAKINRIPFMSNLRSLNDYAVEHYNNDKYHDQITNSNYNHNYNYNKQRTESCDYGDYVASLWSNVGSYNYSGVSNHEDDSNSNLKSNSNAKETTQYQMTHPKSRLTRIILTEKTPVYMASAESGMLLMYYSTIKPIKFYVILREPIQQVFSSYHYQCLMKQQRLLLNSHSNKDYNYNDQDKMECNKLKISEKIGEDLKLLKYNNYHFNVMFKLLNKRFLSIINQQKNTNNILFDIKFNIFDKSVIENHIDGFYSSRLNSYAFWRFFGDHEQNKNKNNHDQYSTIAMSCYYPQLRMLFEFYKRYWYENQKQKQANFEKSQQEEDVNFNFKPNSKAALNHMFKHNFYINSFDFGDVLKIFTYEQLQGNSSVVIWKLKCWLVKESNKYFDNSINEYVTLECKDQYRDIPKSLRPRRTKLHRFRDNEFIDKKILEFEQNININYNDINDENYVKITRKLKQLYQGCNWHLHQFLKENINVLLDKTQFQESNFKLWK